MYSVKDWAEVHRLYEREHMPKAAIARRLGMTRNTVSRLLELSEPPRYRRPAKGSMLEPFHADIAAMLDEDAEVAATVVLERLRRQGYSGGITILKDHLATVRPGFLAARSFQRTTYLPGEVGHADWWEPGQRVPVGKDATRKLYALVATLPHSAAHAAVFTHSKTLADVRPAFVGCFARLGGVPEAVVVDNDSSIVATGRGRTAKLHDEVSALFGHLGAKVIVLEPRKPESKGQVERTNGYLERSFLPLRQFSSLADVQAQHDDWAHNVAYRRHHRRVGARVDEAWAVERGFLRPLPDPLPDTDAHVEVRCSKDGFVRVGGADYSVPPGLGGRHLQVRVSADRVMVTLEGNELACHRRSFVPADVVLDPRHARALRLAREARARLEDGDVEVPAPDLGRYDALAQERSGPWVHPDEENGSTGLVRAGFSEVAAG